MRLQDDIDFTTLTWVKQELDDTLKQSQQALEAYVEDTSDKSQMRFCASYLHQVQGTLRMVELYGAAMVVEEMERLALGLLDGQVKQADDAYTVLMRGMVQLPDYLERLQGGHRDIPIVLLPLLNDLRACRGEKLLSETSLFSPDLGAPLPSSAGGAKSVVPQPMVAANGGRLRLAFQFGLLKWFKGEDIDGNLTRLIAILDRFRSMCTQPDARRLLWVGAGALEAVLVKSIEASVALKLLIGRVDRELKRLIDAGEASFAAAPANDLTKGLLYYVAQSSATSQRVAELRQVYKLDKLMPSEAELEHARGALSGHNRALLDTVGTAIKEDLLRVKDALDLYLRTGSGNVDDLAPQGEALHRVADTLGMLGLGVPRRVVLDQQDVLERIVRGRQPAEESALLDIAGSLLYVESSLDDHIERLGGEQQAPTTPSSGFELPQAEVRKILDATTKEASANIQQAKQDIVAFIESPWDHSKIEQIPRLLDEISGAMRMLNLPEPAALLGGVVRFAEVELLQHRRVPSGDQLDLMADAIASIEFYLEAVKEGRRNRDKILDVTRRSLEALGYWPLPEEGAEVAAETADETPPVAEAAVEAASEFPSFSDTFETERTQPPESDSVTLQIDGGQQLPEIELPQSDASAVDALIHSLDLPEPTAAADAAAPESLESASAEMSSAVEIAPGESLDDLVIGEIASEPVTPSIQNLDELRITSAEFEPPESVSADEGLQSPVEEAIDLDSSAVETAVEVEAASSEQAADFTPAPSEELEIQPEASIETPVAALDAPEPEAADSTLEAEALVVPEAVETPSAPVEQVPEAPLPDGMPTGFSLPDVGFHSVPSDEIDDEIREVFVEEVQDELDNLNKQYPAWKNDLGDFEKLKPVRRSFHTLKGSGRLVGALAIGEYAWKIENMLNRVLDKTIQPTPAVLDLLDHAIAALPGMLLALKGEGQPDANIGAIMWVSDQLSSGQEVWLPKFSPAPVVTADAKPASEAGVPESTVPAEVDVDMPADGNDETDAAVVLEEAEQAQTDDLSVDADEQPEAQREPSPLEVDPMLMDILSSEVEGHLATIRGYLGQAAEIGPQPVTEELLRAVHTLNGALAMVDLPLLTRVVAPLEGYLKRLRARGLQPAEEGMVALTESAECISEVMAAVGGGSELPDTSGLAERVSALRDGLPPPDHPYHGFGIHVADEVRDEVTGAEDHESADATNVETAPLPWYEAELDAEAAEAADEGETVGTVEMTEVFDAAEDDVSPDTLNALAELAAEELRPDEDLPVEDLGEAVTETGASDDDALTWLTDVEDVAVTADESDAGAALDDSPAGDALAPEAMADDLEALFETSIEELPESEPVEAAADVADALSAASDLEALFDSELSEESDQVEVAAHSSETESARLGESEHSADELQALGEFADLTESPDDELAGLTETEAFLADLGAFGDEAGSDGISAEVRVEETTDSEAEAIDDGGLWSLDDSEEQAAVGSDEAFDGNSGEDARERDDVPVSALLAEHDADLEMSSDEAEAFAGEVEGLDKEAEGLAIEVEALSDQAVGLSDEVAEPLSEAEEQLEDEAERSDQSLELAADSIEPATVTDGESLSDRVEETEIEAAAGADEGITNAASMPVDQSEETIEPVIAAEAETAVAANHAAAFAGDVDPEGPLDLPDMDMDLLDIFVEEAVDILDHADGAMAQLRENPEDREPVASLQRDLHTLKGGARMAGLYPVGDLSHAMESLFESIVHGERAASRASIEALEKAFDRLHGMVQRVKVRQAIALPEHTIARLEAILEGREAEFDAELAELGASAAEAAEAQAAAETLTGADSGNESTSAGTEEAPVRKVIPARAPTRSGAQRRTQLDEDEVAARAAQQELIRVRADLLDNLVNFAGEVSIYRSRLEAQMGGFRFNLVEFEQTVSRLRDQLRKLEMETEAQILSRFQRETEQSGNTEFDPLELDRFSTLQQLSRALAESVSDLVSIQNLLDDIARQSETLLLQQSRVSSDLQEGLMRTRMVPFESLVPRLRRILRQTASELGKKAQLKVEGTQGEMDRTVLERMTAPFEHMLRNSLAHGIELPENRVAKGKPEEGTVSIKVSREATEVLIQVTDDGSGMNRDAIRTKAIERGLMTPDATLSDRDIFQFVLEAGFSTASEVSKVAGRGVGMDVVASEVKQLGGSLELDSDVGIGTRITIRLPFTLAVAQAVMVRLGEATYAIPMTSITGVTRMPRKELERRLEQKQLDISYGGEIYQIYDLGDLLRSPVGHGIDETQVPLLMSKTGDQRAAVRVTQVIGSKEVVVKSAGAQLSIVPGIFGATIMGDGRVVVILDLAPLVRHGVALRQAPELAAELELMEPTPEPAPRRQPLVMVVDDSITMRKVTTRVLERSNIDVFTAKDGLDAVEQLQDRMPDVILLDIEMPRMDGYEVATYIRNDNRLKHIPIIMITSRTGEKHRQRALEVGVDRYLGKPYQETDLLKNVQDALAAGHANVH
ncbi:MAG: Hpt domain-containing protein [Xanthomonadales bacterium]|nr:Hpt domain-containing protein [Xanthomonadales bacterium]